MHYFIKKFILFILLFQQCNGRFIIDSSNKFRYLACAYIFTGCFLKYFFSFDRQKKVIFVCPKNKPEHKIGLISQENWKKRKFLFRFNFYYYAEYPHFAFDEKYNFFLDNVVQYIFFPFLMFPEYRSIFNLIPADKDKKFSFRDNVNSFVISDFYVLYDKEDILKIIQNSSFKNNMYECQAQDIMSIFKLLLQNDVSN